MQTETAESPAPAELLIPEAREHQRTRYRRSAAFLAIAAAVVAAVVVAALLLWGGPATQGNPRSDPKAVAAAAAGTSGLVYFRPVLCFAAAYAAPAGGAALAGTEPIPDCAAGSLLSVANVAVEPGANSPVGFSSASTPPDPQYASYPSTSTRTPGFSSRAVLLPGLHGACDENAAVRCVLGPVEMSSRSIGKVTVQPPQDGSGWIVDYTMSSAGGSALWDKVAEENFHQFLGVEVGGFVYTTPLMLPTQTSFSSFDGKGELSGNFSRATALYLAKALSAHKG
jgi:hypothetical protein